MTDQTPARAMELSENEEDPGLLWAEIIRLRAAVQGPDGYASWQDAATAERIRRVKAEAALAARPEGAPTPQAAEPVDPWSEHDLRNGYRYRYGSKVYCCAASAWEAGHSDDCASKRAAPPQPAAAPEDAASLDLLAAYKQAQDLACWANAADTMLANPRKHYESACRLRDMLGAATKVAAPEDAAGQGALTDDEINALHNAHNASRYAAMQSGGWDRVPTLRDFARAVEAATLASSSAAREDAAPALLNALQRLTSAITFRAAAVCGNDDSKVEFAVSEFWRAHDEALDAIDAAMKDAARSATKGDGAV